MATQGLHPTDDGDSLATWPNANSGTQAKVGDLYVMQDAPTGSKSAPGITGTVDCSAPNAAVVDPMFGWGADTTGDMTTWTDQRWIDQRAGKTNSSGQ